MRMITVCTHAWGSLAVGVLLVAAKPVAAQSCTTDGDCGAGYVCHTEIYQSCTGQSCKPGVPCPPPTCDSNESKYCINAPCSVDADCPSSMSCYASTYTECSGGSAMTPGCDAGGGGCDAPPAVDAGAATECHIVTAAATCTPRYQLPCQADADCGTGFICEEQIYTVCSVGGMGGSPATTDGGATMPSGSAGSTAAVDAGPSGSECHEEPSGNFACRLLELPCSADADCADGLECQSNPYAPSCGSAGDAGVAIGAVGGSGGSAVDGGVAIEVDAGSSGCGTSPSHVCAPHSYYGSGMFPNGGGTSGGSGSSAADAGVQPPQDPGGGSGSTSSGSAGAGSGSAGHGPHHDHHHHAGHFPHLGCAVSGGDASSQLASWFGLIGLVACGLRRRTRRTV